MKTALLVVGGLLLLAIAYGAMQYFASERVEVVTLHTLDAGGQPQDTRLWVMDYQGAAYLRTHSGAAWYARLQARPNFEVTRGGVRARYTGVPHPELSATINQLMREKYGWGDAYISFMVGGREGAVPVRLVPAPNTP